MLILRCLAEAIVEQGIRGLAGLVPGGTYLVDVSAKWFEKYELARLAQAVARETARKEAADVVRAELTQLALANYGEARKVAVEAVRQVASSASVEDRVTLELYLSQVPGATRASLKRPSDPSGTTVPPDFVLRLPDDLRRLLPEQPLQRRPKEVFRGTSDWTLSRPLGCGGYGEVWLAQAGTSLGAMKFCRPELTKALRHEERMIRRVMKAGTHPGIVALLEADLDASTPWLLYEYVHGGDLRDWILGAQVSPVADRVGRTVDVLTQLCQAVAHFHRLDPSIVHRDLKPSNILVDRASNRLRVTDFGIGSLAAGAALGPDTGGTTAALLTKFMYGAHSQLYSSPQQQAGDPPDPRDDVHALGVIAYHLLTGKLGRVPGTDFGAELHAAGVPIPLIEVVGACVAQDPTRRPADADDLLHRLGRVTAAAVGTGSRPPPPLLPPRDRSWAEVQPRTPPAGERYSADWDEPLLRRRRKRGSGAGVALLIVGVALLVLIPMGGVLWKVSGGGRDGAKPTRVDHAEIASPGERPAPAAVTRLSPPIAAPPAPAPRPQPAFPPLDLKGLSPEVFDGRPIGAGSGPTAAPAAEIAPPGKVAPPQASPAAYTAPNRDAILALARDIQAKDQAKRIAALQLVASYGAEANIVGETIIEAMWDRHQAVRRAAGDALEKTNPKVYPHIVTISYGLDKSNGFEGLGRLRTEATIAVPILIKCQAEYLVTGTVGGQSIVGNNFGPTDGPFKAIAAIAPKDRRFAEAVLAAISAPAIPRRRAGGGVTNGDEARSAGLAQLGVIDATPAEKTTALVPALRDGKRADEVIRALGQLGRGAEAALPVLRQLRLSPDDIVRRAATEAVALIER